MDILSQIDADTVLGDCLETAFQLKTYVAIMQAVQADGFESSEAFRTMYNGFYKVRQRKKAWYDRYYTLMAEQVKNPKPYKLLLQEMSEWGAVEASFVSKLVATADGNRPIWDRYVIQNIGLEQEWKQAANKPRSVKIERASQIYHAIEEAFQYSLTTPTGKRCIAVFDEALPQYKDIISDVKKIDYMLWSKR